MDAIDPFEDNVVTPDLYSDEHYLYNYDMFPKRVEFLQYYFHIKTVNRFVNHLRSLAYPVRILDLGGGIGAEGCVLRNNISGSEIVSMDISTVGCRTSRKDHQNTQVQGDSNLLPFVSGSFDAIHCKDMLVHIADKSVFLQNLADLLVSNGILLIVSCITAFPGFVQWEWNKEELIESASIVGLELKEQETIAMETDDWYTAGRKRSFFVFMKK